MGGIIRVPVNNKKAIQDDSECAEVADANEVLPESEISEDCLQALSAVREFQ